MPTPDPQGYGWRVRWKHVDIKNNDWQQVSFRRDRNETIADAQALCDFLDQVVSRRIADDDDRILAKTFLRKGALFMAPEVPRGFLTVRELVLQYEETKARSQTTQDEYDWIKVRHFQDWLDQPAVAITTADLKRKYDELTSTPTPHCPNGLKPSTARTVLNVMAPAFRWGYHEGKLKSDPTLNVKFLTKGSEFFANNKPLTELTYRSLLNVAVGLALVFLRLLGETGIRLGEAFALDVEDVDYDRGVLHIRHHMVGTKRKPGTKGGPEAVREVPFGRVLGEMLAGAINDRQHGPVFLSIGGRARLGRPQFYRDIWGPFVTAARAAKLIGRNQPLHPHVLRHSFATWRAHSGKVTAYQLMRLMGHAQLTTTQHYFGDEGNAVDAGRAFLDDEKDIAA